MVNKQILVPVLVIVVAITIVEILNKTKHKHPDAGLNIEQLVQKYGYPIERHQVTTDDGYILTLHRIPHGSKQTHHKRIPVLLMHGFTQSAVNFVTSGPEKALGLLLVDKGYDVWLGNARGTTWSRNHTVLDPDKDAAFWDFSLHEIGVHDLPAFIDYILEVTGEEALHYVGYSQGTSIFFILLSQKEGYGKKIRLMTALAPAMFLNDPKGVFWGPLMYFRRFLEVSFEFFNIWEIFSEDGLVSRQMKHLCDENSIFVSLCLLHMVVVHGYDYREVNKTMLSLWVFNTPAGASPKQFFHIVQWAESGEFHQYDLGVDGNLQKYLQRDPPRYDLSKVTSPVALYYSSNDLMVNIDNMDRVRKTLPNVVRSYHVPLESFNHDDFVNSQNAVGLLYNAVIEEIMKF